MKHIILVVDSNDNLHHIFYTIASTDPNVKNIYPKIGSAKYQCGKLIEDSREKVSAGDSFEDPERLKEAKDIYGESLCEECLEKFFDEYPKKA